MPGRAEKRRQRQLRFQRMPDDKAKALREAAFDAIRRLYAECLPLWQSCRRGQCRRHRRCIGNSQACLKRAWPLVPRAVQEAVFAQVRNGGPRRVPPATEREQSLRSYPPTNFVR